MDKGNSEKMTIEDISRPEVAPQNQGSAVKFIASEIVQRRTSSIHTEQRSGVEKEN